MPRVRITDPSGRGQVVDVPEGATRQQMLEALKPSAAGSTLPSRPAAPSPPTHRSSGSDFRAGAHAAQKTLGPIADAVKEAAPYLALGAIPGLGPAAIAARVGGAGLVGALQSAPGERLTGAASSAALQGLGGELLAPTMARIAPAGLIALRRYASSQAGRLMAGIKEILPWTRGLADGDRGLAQFVGKEGQEALEAGFGRALAASRSALARVHFAVPVEQLEALKVEPAYVKLWGQTFPVTTARDRHALATMEALGARVYVRGEALLDALPRLATAKNEEVRMLAGRLRRALAPFVPDDFRRQYGEGVQAIKALRRIRAVDPATGRLDITALEASPTATIQGDRTVFDVLPPEMRALLRRLVPAGRVPARRVTGHLFVPMTHTGASIPLGARSVPFTPLEVLATRAAPGLIRLGASLATPEEASP